MAIIFFLILTGLISLYLYLTRNFNYWKNKHVDYIKPILIFGNIYEVCVFKQSIGGFMYHVYNSSKSAFVGCFAFNRPSLLIRDPQMIKQCLIKDFEYFFDRSVAQDVHADSMGSNMLFIMKNLEWKALRAKVSPAFSSGKLKGMLPLIIEASTALVDYIKDVSVIQKFTDCRDISMKYSTDVIASCAFGVSANSFTKKDAEFRKITKQVFQWNFVRTVETTAYFFSPFLVKLLKLKFVDNQTSNFLRRILSFTINEREESNSYRGDFLDTLIHLKLDTNFDNDKIIGTACQLFLAGFETTGTTISYALYELALNQEIQQRLRTEIQKILYKHRSITYEAIQEMKYLNMTTNETLRKYPALPFLDRCCTKDYQIPGTDVIIEKGVPVYISLLGLHYDEELFPEPHKFNPERFADENKVKDYNCVFLPFGDGVRNCLGQKFGLLSVKVALIQIISNFNVIVSKDTPKSTEFNTRGFLITPMKELRLKLLPCSKPSIG